VVASLGLLGLAGGSVAVAGHVVGTVDAVVGPTTDEIDRGATAGDSGAVLRPSAPRFHGATVHITSLAVVMAAALVWLAATGFGVPVPVGARCRRSEIVPVGRRGPPAPAVV